MESIVLLLTLLLACGAPSPEPLADTGAHPDTSTDTGGDTDRDAPNPWGFAMRLPGEATVDCAGTPTVFPDADWICTLDDGAVAATLYLQASPVACVASMTTYPEYETFAQVTRGDGPVESLAAAHYDWGGNHNNDFASFELGDRSYMYWHSSFGSGWRACQEMDCLRVAEIGGPQIEDGCTCDRTLPVVCRAVTADGTWGSLEDTFAVCSGDDTCG